MRCEQGAIVRSRSNLRSFSSEGCYAVSFQGPSVGIFGMLDCRTGRVREKGGPCDFPTGGPFLKCCTQTSSEDQQLDVAELKASQSISTFQFSLSGLNIFAKAEKSFASFGI